MFPSLADATDVANKISTSQIALPEDICDEVHNSVDGYSASIRNFSQVSLATDNVFSDDGGVLELGTMSGTADSGLTVALIASVSSATRSVVDGPGSDGAPNGVGGGPGGPPAG